MILKPLAAPFAVLACALSLSLAQAQDAPRSIATPAFKGSENPGAHHRVSENASATEPAKLLAVFVVDASETALTTPDPK